VWIGDVADAFVNALDNRATFGRTYDLVGPKVYTLKELVEFAAAASGHPRPVVALPDGVARVQARMMELAPGEPLMSRDNLDSMKVDNVAGERTPAPELGITPTAMEAEAPGYLSGHTVRTRLDAFRARARR
jgi:NADH dehydrogenase